MTLAANLTTTNEGLRGELTLLGRVPFTTTPSSMEIMLGGRYQLGPVELYAMGGPGIGATPGTPAFRVLLGAGLSLPDRRCAEGASYEPKDCPKLDQDHDGVLNGVDECPTVPGVAAYNGCPVPDTDGDGIPDDQDRCPKQKGPASTHGCPDTDKDGVADIDDRCPTVPGPKDNKGCPLVDTDEDGVSDDLDECPKIPGPKANKGCPYADSDNDGLNDKEDRCPHEAGPKENQGCPWPDADTDGTPDKDDECPSVAGPRENKGCPWPDTDGDGVTDDIDNCPKDKGPADNQGCPKAKKQLVIITREKLVIKEKVFFETGKATIKPQSFVLLNQIADVLNDHPAIAKVMIEGHTDNVGKPEANRVLSMKRAESVRDYLVKKNVLLGRLEAKGYGPDLPADVNTSAAGRENNRRVEFVVVNPDAPKSDVQEVTP